MAKYLESKYNVLNIQPKKFNVNERYNYHLGVYNKTNEVIKSPNGTSIEDYFPLIVENLNKRGNWDFVDRDNNRIDFCWSNSMKIDAKAKVHNRITLDSEKNYLSNKMAFYTKFANYNFIPKFESFSKYEIGRASCRERV